MSSAISVLRKRWLPLAAVAVLVAIALTVGTLFAANERRQPENPTVAQQSVADAADPGHVADLPAVPPAPERVFSQPADNEMQIDLPPVTKQPPAHPNLDANLNRLVEQAQTAPSQPNSADGSGESNGTGSGSAADPVLVTFYVEPEHVAAVRQYLEDNDVYVRNVGEDYIEAHVPPLLLPAASEQTGVLRVDTVIPPQPAQSQGNTVSQGVALHHADDWHNAGYRGQGIKVGIIDIGFEKFRELQGKGELPGNVMARCYFNSDDLRLPSSSLADCETNGDHGTLVTEAVIDVAPDVELYIANPWSSGDIRNAVEWMVESQVDVINMSLVFLYQGPGDGTSYFSNGVIRSIDAAVSGGIVFVNSAGNGAKRTWYGAFRDPDRNDWHNFARNNADAANRFYLEFSDDAGRDIFAQLRWQDSWGGADCNLDLYLSKFVSGEGYTPVAVDNAVQDGGDRDIPRAWVSFEVPSVAAEGLYALFVLKRNCTDEPDWIQLQAWEIPELWYYSPEHHIGNPAESRNPGMLAVGATHWWDTEYIADYSSRGPTIDGRVKPDITGVACARTSKERSTPGSACWFSGTSQAAPHVAGMAALVRQRFPNYTPAQVTDYLKRNATERGTAGTDSVWGHGFAVLPTSDSPSPSGDLQPITNLSVQAGPVTGEVTLSWDAVADATHYRIGYVNMEVDYNLAKASCTGEWIEAFVYVDVNARNIPVSNGRAEYTVRRIASGARHAFTVLTSNDFVDTGGGGSVSSEFFWPSTPRWQFLEGRRDLPPGVTIPTLDCPQ